MEKKGKETYVLEHLRPYLIHSPGISNVLEALRFNISDLEYRLILRRLQKLDDVSGWNILLDAMKRSPTSEAFTEFRRIVHYDEIFLHIKEMFENRCKEIGLEIDTVALFKPKGKKKTADLGLRDGRSATLFQRLIELIPYWSSQKEHRANFESQSYNLLESGYKFKYLIVSSYVDDLINQGGLTVKKLKDARAAFQYMLPYAFNLYQYANQKEYRIIKKYTAYYICYIKDNLKSAPEIADTVFRTMGYKASKFPDELHLESVSRSIAEVAFELYLCDLEFGRIISVVEDAELRYGMAVGETIGIWQALLQKNRGSWRREKIDVFIANHMNEKGIADRLQSVETKRSSPIRSGAIMREEVPIRKPVDSIGMQYDSSLHVSRYPGAGAVSRVQEIRMRDRLYFTTDSLRVEEATKMPANTIGQYDPSMHKSRYPNAAVVDKVQGARKKDRSSFTPNPIGIENQYSRQDSDEWMYDDNSSKPGQGIVADESVSQMPALTKDATYITEGPEKQTWAPSTERITGNDTPYGFEDKDRTGIGHGTELKKPPIGIDVNRPPGYGSDYSGKANAKRDHFDNPLYGSTFKIMHPPENDELYGNTGTSSTTIGDATYRGAYSHVSRTASSKKEEDLYANVGVSSSTKPGDATYGESFSYASVTAGSKKGEDLYANLRGSSSTEHEGVTYGERYSYASVTASSKKDEDLYANVKPGSVYTPNATSPYATDPYPPITASSNMPGSQMYRSGIHVSPPVSDPSSQIGYQSQGTSGNKLDSFGYVKAKLPPIDVSSAQDSRGTNRERSNSKKEGYENVAIDSMTAGRISNTSMYVDTGMSGTPYENHAYASYKKLNAGNIGDADYIKPFARGYSDLRRQCDSANSGFGQQFGKVDVAAQGSHAAQMPSLIDDKGIPGVRDVPRNDVSEKEEIDRRVAESMNRARQTQIANDYLRHENVLPDVYGKSGDQYSQKYTSMSSRTSAYPSKVESEPVLGTYIGEAGRYYKADDSPELSALSDRPINQIPDLYSQ